MIDPLSQFSWGDLHKCYDCKCRQSGRFNTQASALSVFSSKPASDRSLYYELGARIAQERKAGMLMSLDTYGAIIYWKMYSTAGEAPNNAIHNKPGILPRLKYNLSQFNSFPSKIMQDKVSVLDLVNQTLKLQLYYMRLPVCTTVLHFLYPDLIPIFDKMTLMAVEPKLIKEQAEELTQSQKKYGEYVDHVWSLVNRYRNQIRACRFSESPVRAIEMALWITR